MARERRPATTAVWGGETGHARYEGATQVPVVHSVSFGYESLDEWRDVALGKRPGHIYSRNTNPTVRAFEEKVAALERAEAATSFASGMAAISATLFTLLRPGDRVVSIKDSYGGTHKLFVEFLLSEEGLDIISEREASIISYREGYKPPESVKKYMLDLGEIKVIAIKDELETNKQFKRMRQEWRKVFQQ